MLVILNLIILESLLSIDNAAVLATMVQGLPAQEKQKALTYGILGAYLMRGLCIVFASFLIKIFWLKLLGGLYLIYLAYKFFYGDGDGGDSASSGSFLNNKLGMFRGTVVAIEFADLAFSLDNVFAAVAMSNNIWYIITGCFIGIAAIRFASSIFIKAVDKYPELESVAFGVIGLLGVKLVLSYASHYIPVLGFIDTHAADMITSVLTVLVFLFPVLKDYVKVFKTNS